MSFAAAVIVAALAAAPAPKADPLAAARAAAETGDYEKVLDVVSAAPDAPPAEAASLLTRAGQLALEKQDKAMASLFCEMAIKRAPGERAPLDLCLKVALADERWEDVDAYGEALFKLAPKDPDLALARAQAALAEGDWGRACDLLRPHAKGPRAGAVAPLLEQAEQHQREEGEAAQQQRELEKKLKKALAQARALERGEAASAQSKRASADEVVLYTTSWCGVCKKAKAWLQQQHVAYTERDVERDSGATEELAAKCKKAHLRPSGVPVLDAGGKLLVGFDPHSYSKALHPHR